MTRVAVVGLGSIGRRHVRLLCERGDEVAVVRRTREAAAESRHELGVEAFSELGALAAWGAEAVVVANPTSLHVETALAALRLGCHVLVEKPLSHSLDGVDDLLSAAAASGLRLGVATNLRFHPAVETIRAAVLDGAIGRLLCARAEVGTDLPSWHPGEDHRAGYAARADLGGGAFLTLVHELDLLVWIAGDPVWSTGTRARVGNVTTDVEDVADAVVRHASGCVGSVHMDLLDQSFHRRSRWVGERGSIEWSWGGPVRLLTAAAESVLWEDADFDLDDTYRRELDDFLESYRTGAAPRGTGSDARKALEVAATVEWIPA